MAGYGLYGYSTKIISTNCVIGDCGYSSLALDKGGYYDFRQLTIGNFWSGSVRTSPALYVSNYTYDGLGNKVTNPLERAYFGNAIIWGAQDEEIYLDSIASAGFNYTFDHCLLNTKMNTGNTQRFISCIINKDPVFVNTMAFNYSIDSISPAIDKGGPVGIQFDIKGIDRGSNPDIGAYEYVKR
jgi:hypothetical protein